jgi:hypothetical protein
MARAKFDFELASWHEEEIPKAANPRIEFPLSLKASLLPQNHISCWPEIRRWEIWFLNSITEISSTRLNSMSLE